MFLAPLFWFLSRPTVFRKYIYQNKQLRLSLCILFFFSSTICLKKDFKQIPTNLSSNLA